LLLCAGGGAIGATGGRELELVFGELGGATSICERDSKEV